MLPPSLQPLPFPLPHSDWPSYATLPALYIHRGVSKRRSADYQQQPVQERRKSVRLFYVQFLPTYLLICLVASYLPTHLNACLPTFKTI